ncbi:hypothetical protein FACS1894113_4160 [Alphaproteobacteria bacterium]|nr:hypothetical protein FACS1894113_4160 [Alphaproteobacteria bacterium]
MTQHHENHTWASGFACSNFDFLQILTYIFLHTITTKRHLDKDFSVSAFFNIRNP